MPNEKVIRDMIAYLREEPRRIDMGTWGEKLGSVYIAHRHDLPPCGTVACLAGTALIVTDQAKWNSTGQLCTKDGRDIPIVAIEAMGLPADKWNEMFFSYRWPEPFASDWARSDGDRRARVVINFLESLIAPKETIEEDANGPVHE